MTITPAPHEGTVPGQDIELHYREWSGPPDATPLLLLHGLASAGRIWDLAAPLLAQHRRVVALDQRGHGLSTKPESGYEFATVVADDIAAARALGLGERYAIAGHSWGANVALELAAAHPTQVAGLALVDGGFAMLRQRSGATWERVSRELAPPDFAGTPRVVFLDWIHNDIPGAAARPEIDEIELNIVELRPDDTVGPRLSRAHHMRILRALWDEDPDNIYPAVRCPTLFVLAEPAPPRDDDAFLAAKRDGIARARSLLNAAPRLDVIWLADTVHDVPLQRPELLAEHIQRFLAASEL